MSRAKRPAQVEKLPLRFRVPPSLGSVEALERTRGLTRYLEMAVSAPVQVEVAPDYRALREALAAGTADAVWAPPFVCARLEAHGMRALVRGVRDGASTYRAALVCRREALLSLRTLHGKRAAWVDPDSTGGYLLAAALLKSKGLDPARIFAEQRFLGSYKEALLAVERREADVTSIFAPPGTEASSATGISDVLPKQVRAFEVVAFTEETPNDGIVVSPRLKPTMAAALGAALLSMHGSDEGRALLARTFRMERFESAPAGRYASLYKLAVAAL